jgi:hypothetical protein
MIFIYRYFNSKLWDAPPSIGKRTGLPTRAGRTTSGSEKAGGLALRQAGCRMAALIQAPPGSRRDR